jgi:uncharacterized protein DUF1631
MSGMGLITMEVTNKTRNRMSELGRSGPDASSPEPASGPLTDAKIIERLKGCQKLVVEHARPVFDHFLEILGKQLLDFADQAKSNQEQAEYFALAREFKSQTDELSRYFIGYLGEGFIKFKNQELDTTTGEEKFQGDMLSLVDNEDLEETIAISSITRRSENYYAESIWSLNQRFAVLNRGRKVNEQGNPVSPIQYCESLRRALCLLTLETKAKLIAYKAFDREFIAQLGDVLDGANEYLMAEGILPNLRYSPVGEGAPPVPHVEEIGVDELPMTGESEVQLPSGMGRPPVQPGVMQSGAPQQGMVAAPDPALPTEQYQGRLVDAIKVLQGHIAQYGAEHDGVADGSQAGTVAGADLGSVGQNPVGQSPVGPGSVSSGVAPGAGVSGGEAGSAVGGVAGGRQALVYTSQHLVGALQGLQTQALAVTGAAPGELMPVNIAAATGDITRELRNEAEGEDRDVDPSDMHTIDLVGMLFEYMLSDDNLPDSVKALLSYLHTPFLKIAFIDKSFFEQTEHPARLLLNSLAEAGVKWVGNDGSSQYDIYDKIKTAVSRVLEEFKNDVRLFAELLLEFSGYTKKISRRQELMERRAMEKVQGEEKLREVKIQVNQEVRSRTDGRELPSAVLLMLLQPWSDYLAFILLRYGDQSDSWQRATQTIDDILWSIESKDSNADKTRQLEMHDRLLDAIETGFETIGYDQAKGKKLLEALFSLQKMALQSKQVEPAPEPMRNKLESMAAEKAGQSITKEDKPTDEEARMVENLKMIEFGTWFEFSGGKRLKVAWYNSKTLHYMLVDQMGKKVAMKSGLQLARSMLAGEAKVIAGSTKPFFERALENIFQSLNVKAESMGSADE